VDEPFAAIGIAPAIAEPVIPFAAKHSRRANSPGIAEQSSPEPPAKRNRAPASVTGRRWMGPREPPNSRTVLSGTRNSQEPAQGRSDNGDTKKYPPRDIARGIARTNALKLRLRFL
jgi:hypothetical protein